jgi:hypothetical protein
MRMRSVINGLAAALLLIVLAGPVWAADDPAARGAALLAQAKAASGGPAWDALGGWHESGAAIVGGVQGTYDTWCDLRRMGMANHHVLAGAAQMRGFDGATVWISDNGGPVRAFQTPQALATARQGAYVSAWGFFFPDRFAAQRVYIGSASVDGFEFDIVQVAPQDGLPMELWIDRKSHLVTRMVDRTGPRTAVAVLSDFRVVDGVLTPFLVAESDGDPKHTLELHINAIDFSPIDPARFAPPPR